MLHATITPRPDGNTLVTLELPAGDRQQIQADSHEQARLELVAAARTYLLATVKQPRRLTVTDPDDYWELGIPLDPGQEPVIFEHRARQHGAARERLVAPPAVDGSTQDRETADNDPVPAAAGGLASEVVERIDAQLTEGDHGQVLMTIEVSGAPAVEQTAPNLEHARQLVKATARCHAAQHPDTRCVLHVADPQGDWLLQVPAKPGQPLRPLPGPEAGDELVVGPPARGARRTVGPPPADPPTPPAVPPTRHPGRRWVYGTAATLLACCAAAGVLLAAGPGHTRDRTGVGAVARQHPPVVAARPPAVTPDPAAARPSAPARAPRPARATHHTAPHRERTAVVRRHSPTVHDHHPARPAAQHVAGVPARKVAAAAAPPTATTVTPTPTTATAPASEPTPVEPSKPVTAAVPAPSPARKPRPRPVAKPEPTSTRAPATTAPTVAAPTSTAPPLSQAAPPGTSTGGHRHQATSPAGPPPDRAGSPPPL